MQLLMAAMATNLDIRPSPIAGKWYSQQPAGLRAEMEHYLSKIGAVARNGKLHAIIVPHAAYQYSGQVAAHAFALLRGMRFERVAVLSPFHGRHTARLLTSAHDAYATPLGLVEVDIDSITEVNDYLTKVLGSGLHPIAHDSEHALEIELPFLQFLLGRFRLLPIMVRDQTWKTAQAVGEALAKIKADQNMLLVASTDLSHFYSHPAAQKLDGEVLRCIEAMDPHGIIRAEDEGIGFACGRGALAAVLLAARLSGANRARVLCHSTSGEVNGDYERVVGYGAAVVYEEHSPA